MDIFGDPPKIKKLWHFEFEQGSQWENVKCGISRKQKTVE